MKKEIYWKPLNGRQKGTYAFLEAALGEGEGGTVLSMRGKTGLRGVTRSYGP